jgi:hypothetical protein
MMCLASCDICYLLSAVLAAGDGTNLGQKATAELYDPTSGTWTSTGALAPAKYNFQMVLLPAGKGVELMLGLTNPQLCTKCVTLECAKCLPLFYNIFLCSPGGWGL